MPLSPRQRKRKRSVAVPPPPPASLVRLLQTDTAVLDYFTALQDALAVDVQKWKERAHRAEAAAAQLDTNTNNNNKPVAAAAAANTAKRKRAQPKRKPPPSVVVTTAKPAGLKGVDDAAFHFLDSESDDDQDDAVVRGKTPVESQEEEEAVTLDAAEPSANDQHMLSYLQDDSSASSSDDDDDQQLQERIDLAMLSEGAERMLQSLEIELCEKVPMELQKGESPVKQDGTTPHDVLQATETTATDGEPPTEQGQTGPLFSSKERKHIDVANEIRHRFADQPYNPQVAEALRVLDATGCSGIVDEILHHSSSASWMAVSLQAWRGQYQQSLQALLDCLVRDHATIVLPALDACFLLDDCWIHGYVRSIFTSEMEAANTMVEALAFCIRQTVDLLQQKDEKDDEAASTLAFTRWKETAARHDWLDTGESQTSPSDLISRVLGIRSTLPSPEQRTIWLSISQIVIVRADSKDVPKQQHLQESITNDTNGEMLGLLLCHVERQLTLRSNNSNRLPTNALPSSLACSVTLADGHNAISCIHALLRKQLPAPNSHQWDLVQQSCTLPTLRVITLERRTDRLAAFVRQALHQGLLVIKGVTPLFLHDTAAEHGSYAYDGSGRLVAAMRRLTETVGEKEQRKTLVAEEWCPNDLKPFDRDAPAAEILVGTTPSEKACALSHVSCWKGIVRAMDLAQSTADDFAEDSTQPRLWRSPQNIVRLFKIAGFAQGRALLPKNEDMAPSPVCVVMEDDAILVDGFKEKLATVLEELPRDFHFCSLGYSRPRSAPIVPLTGSVGVPTMLWYLTGYCVSLVGAQYLLDSLPVVGPVDSWIGLKMAHENWRDSEWGTRLGVGAHAQPDEYPNRAALASLMNFHAYCAVPPLCCQPVGKAAATTNMRGTVVAPTSARRNWRLRDTDIVYSGDFAKLVVQKN